MSAPAVIDVLEFARAEQRLGGALPVESLARLADVVADGQSSLEYELAGGSDSRGRPLITVTVRGALALQCQRCLEPLDYPVAFSSELVVVPVGARPNDADDPQAPDYIEAERELDVAALIEEEVLLHLPFAPRHENECATVQGSGAPAPQSKASPFASLAALKKSAKT